MSTIDIRKPDRRISIDTTFWQHRSIFAGTQEQLDELRREADARARMRAWHELRHTMQAPPRQLPIAERHRPAIRRLNPILHVGLIPMLWVITTCKCGDRWPCNDIKQHLRAQHGWSVDITEELTAITRQLPRPVSRWRRFVNLFRRPRRTHTRRTR